MAAGAVRKGGIDWRHVRVWGLILVSLVLLAYGVYQVGKVFDVFSSRYHLITLVETVAGLREGAPVTLAGQRVGQVDDIMFIPLRSKPGDANLAVRISIAREVQDQIRRDSRAFIRAQGLLGDKFIDIQPGSAGYAVLEPGDTLPSAGVVDLDQVLETANAALEQAHAIVGDLRVLTRGLAAGEGTAGQLLQDESLYMQMSRMTAELAATLNQINHGQGTLSRLIRDPTMYNEVTATLNRVDSLTTALLYGEGTAGQLLRSDSLYRGLVGVVRRADSAVVGVSGAIDRFTASEGTLNRLMTDPALYDELLRSVVELQTLLQDIRAHPRNYRPEVNVDVF